MVHLKITQITYGMKDQKLNKLYEKVINIIRYMFTKQCCR